MKKPIGMILIPGLAAGLVWILGSWILDNAWADTWPVALIISLVWCGLSVARYQATTKK